MPRSRQAEVQSVSWHKLCETQIVWRDRPRSKRWAGGTKDLEQSDAGTSVWRVAVAAAGRDVYGDGGEA